MTKKLFSFMAIAMVASLFAGCGNKEADSCFCPLMMERALVSVDHDQNRSFSFKVVVGNGGYRVFQPREISVGANTIDNSSQDIIKASAEGDVITVERLLLEDVYVVGLFLVMDAKGQKRLLVVDTPGRPVMWYIDEMEENMFKEPSKYWIM